ncbi:MAG: SCP2 sterol-binding domain-containing protein [Anaerolineae bacterium]
MTEKTARQRIEAMPDTFRPERAGRANCVVQFHITGEDGGDWYVTIKDRKCTVTEGIADSANATLRMDAGDYVALATGKLGSMKAFMSGTVKASGDVSLLQRMDRWFVRQ